MKKQTFEELYIEMTEWQDATFGRRGAVPPLHHLSKEVGETIEAIEANVGTPELEFADLLTLLINAAHNYGMTARDLLDYTQQKLEINKRRKWGVPDEKGVVEHIHEEGEE
jgi:NTP pyrophosphatase (non-canonical NTP hydrolase)